MSNESDGGHILRQWVFEKVKIGAGIRWSDEECDLRVERDEEIGQTIIALSRQVFARQIANQESNRVPATLWDHVKAKIGLRHKTVPLTIKTYIWYENDGQIRNAIMRSADPTVKA